MGEELVYSSEFIKIKKQPDGFYIESYRKGMSVDQFSKLMMEHPEIKISSFAVIRNALLFAPRPSEKFGEIKDRVSVDISSDGMNAYVTLCVSEEELKKQDNSSLIEEIITMLNQKGVVFGIKYSVLEAQLCNNRQILIAEGISPQDGEDSAISLYELREAKPEVKEDGNVDHYELNLINLVKAGDWLGERTDPTEGTPGKLVNGNIIPSRPGKKYPLYYDKNSVVEKYENGVTTLIAMRDGAVYYEGDCIGVSNHLEIMDNVDFKTGNINFDGYLTVKGSIEDSFSVSANKDIEILGDYGIGSVREIISRDGSIFIKGGIAGKNKAVVKSTKNIYTKYVSDATIICEGSVHIGFYCLNSNITAKEVILDSTKGQIIGGNIQAEVKVVSSVIGSASEKRTFISIKGFNRKMLKEKLEDVLTQIENLKRDMARYKQEIAVYSNAELLEGEQAAVFESKKNKFFAITSSLKLLEDERKTLVGYLRAHGEGEITVLKKVYPGTVLELRKIVKEINHVESGTSFYLQDGYIKEL